MRNFFIILLGVLLLIGCRSHDPPPDNSVLSQGFPPPRPAPGRFPDTRENTPNEPRYCRIASVWVESEKEVSRDERSGTKSASTEPKFTLTKRRWYVRPVTVTSLASLYGQHYEIVQAYTSPKVVVSPAASLELRDRFALSYEDDQLWLTHDRGDRRNPVYVGHARLTLRPLRTQHPFLWAEGYAFADAGGSEPVGLYRLFLLDDTGNCLHSNSDGRSCQRVLAEFYDTNDELSALNAPVIGTNIHAYPSPECPLVVNYLETSDGEGDEGPNRPR